MNSEQFTKAQSGAGFIAALDQSGGSTPKALKLYGVEEDAYSGDAEMFDMVHQMRTRIITSPAFDGDRIVDVAFDGKGCAISMASASMLTEELMGMTLDEVKALDKDFVLDMLGIEIGPVRLKCALLSLKVVKAGVWGLEEWPE